MEMDLEKQFKHWLRQNGSHIREYTADEIASLAITCGFPLELVCRGTLDHIAYIRRLIRFWDSPLCGQWVGLAMYDNGKTWEG